MCGWDLLFLAERASAETVHVPVPTSMNVIAVFGISEWEAGWMLILTGSYMKVSSILSRLQS